MINIQKEIPIIEIYKITSPSGKIYIGQSINVKKRFNQYKKEYNKRQPKLYNSLKKYGPENHKFEIIEECSIEQLNERETFWKSYYLEQNNNDWSKMLFCELYDNGGGPKSDSTKKKMSISQKGYPQPLYFSKLISKKVFQYDIDGNLVGVFNSIKEAALFTSFDISGISKCCRKMHKLCNGYIFRFENDFDFSFNNINKSHQNKFNKIIQLDLNGLFIREFKNFKEAAKHLNKKDHFPISKCCNGKLEQVWGYKWKFNELYLNQIKIK